MEWIKKSSTVGELAGMEIHAGTYLQSVKKKKRSVVDASG